MNIVKIETTDTVKETAKKIYDEFILHQSCTIKGLDVYENEVIDKGDAVIKEMRLIDRRANWQTVKVNGKDKLRRKRKNPNNSIGGPTANKMFLFQKLTQDGFPVTRIWRAQ